MKSQLWLAWALVVCIRIRCTKRLWTSPTRTIIFLSRLLPQAMLLPRMVLADLYHSYPAAFATYIMPAGGVEKLQQFWQLQKQHPAFRLHPQVAKSSFDATRNIPLQLHGDVVPNAYLVHVGQPACRGVRDDRGFFSNYHLVLWLPGRWSLASSRPPGC